jgi:hypothetical protein
VIAAVALLLALLLVARMALNTFPMLVLVTRMARPRQRYCQAARQRHRQAARQLQP